MTAPVSPSRSVRQPLKTYAASLGKEIDAEVITGHFAVPEASFCDYRTRVKVVSALRTAGLEGHTLEILKTAPPGHRTSVLGYAQPLASAGLNLRVFNDRIRWQAEARDRPYATVLAHVIAHEIGHVLLRPPDAVRADQCPRCGRY